MTSKNEKPSPAFRSREIRFYRYINILEKETDGPRTVVFRASERLLTGKFKAGEPVATGRRCARALLGIKIQLNDKIYYNTVSKNIVEIGTYDNKIKLLEALLDIFL
jgi:hypothetical protein